MTPARRAFAVALAPCLALPISAQTSTSIHHTGATATHRAAGSAAGASADHPPGVPVVRGVARPLYALRYVDVLVGTGPLAEARKFYSVRYTGWTTDGKKFDSSDDHPGKEPITFPYGGHRVIPGWDTGFQGMHVGGKRRLFVPYQLAYGEQGHPPVIPPKADLIFDVELVAQSDAPPNPPAPRTPPPSSPTSQPSGATPAPAAPPSGQPTDPTKPTTAPAASTAPTR